MRAEPYIGARFHDSGRHYGNGLGKRSYRRFGQLYLSRVDNTGGISSVMPFDGQPLNLQPLPPYELDSPAPTTLAVTSTSGALPTMIMKHELVGVVDNV